MIKEIDYTGKNRSIFMCDRCNKEINTSTEKRYKICIETTKDLTSKSMKLLKKYDLCRHCARLIVYNIEKKGK